MRVKDHRQRFAAPLRMPENAAFAVGFGGNNGFFHGFAHGEILMVAGKNFDRLLRVLREADKIFQKIKQALLREHPLIKGVKLRVCGVFVAPVLGFPLHKAVKAGGDGTRLVGGKVADDADCVVDEQGRDIQHIVTQLVVGILCAGVLFGGAFQLHDHQRQAVDKQDDVRAVVVAVFDVCILIYYRKLVVFRIFIVNKMHKCRTVLTIYGIVYLHAILQIFHKDAILFDKTSSLKITNFHQCLTDCIHRQAAVNPDQSIT